MLDHLLGSLRSDHLPSNLTNLSVSLAQYEAIIDWIYR